MRPHGSPGRDSTSGSSGQSPDSVKRKSAKDVLLKQFVTRGRETPPAEIEIIIPALVLPTSVPAKKKNSEVDSLLGALSIFCQCVCGTDPCTESESESDNEPLTCDLVF